MTAALRTELRKLRSTRSLLAVPLAGAVLAVIGTVFLLAVAKDVDIPARLSEHGTLRFGSGNFGLLILVLGIRIVGDEVQHNTLASTLIRNPARRTVLAAKATVAAVVALVLCAVVDLIVIPVTTIGVDARGVEMLVDVGTTAALLGRVAAMMTLLALLGVAIGAAVRNRTVAIVGTILWLVMGETIVGSLLHIQRYLPGSAVSGLVSGTASDGQLAAPQSALLLVAYVAIAALAAVVSLRRDIA